MSDPAAERLAEAQARAVTARARLGVTVSELKHRVSPQALAQDAANTLKDRGLALAATVVDTTRRKPAIAAAVAGGMLLLLVRGRLQRLLSRAASGGDARSPSKSAPRKGSAR